MNFNPRTREGCDNQRKGYTIIIATISIHAPVKGATGSSCHHAGTPDFNPRTREGCDMSYLLSLPVYFDFNPRTREGCDGPIVDFSRGR